MPTLQTKNPATTAKIAGHPLHPILVTLPIGLFIATFLFDILYWWTRDAMWATGALWLIGAGLIGAALAAIAGLTDFLGDRRIRDLSNAWQHAIGNVVLVLVQLFSWYQRFRYGAAVVVPLGISLSLVAILIMAFTGWKGGELVFRNRVGINDEPS